MFANIKNGQTANKSVIIASRKNVCELFLKILWDEGFISGYRIFAQNDKKIEVFLKYSRAGESVVNSFKCLSKPGQRLHYSAKQIWKLNSSKTFIVFSTNKGLKTINQCKQYKIGGEPLVVIN